MVIVVCGRILVGIETGRRIPSLAQIDQGHRRQARQFKMTRQLGRNLDCLLAVKLYQRPAPAS
jgi:hypothetical protein